MSWKNLSAKQIDKLVNKLDLEPRPTRRSKHRTFWYFLDGKKQLTVKLPNIHGGSGSLSTGFINSVKNQLRIDSNQLIDLAKCPMSAEDYERHIRGMLD